MISPQIATFRIAGWRPPLGLRAHIVKKDVGRTRGRSARLATPCAPPAEAPDHGCRRDWEGRVSCQENVLFLFSRPELLGFSEGRETHFVNRRKWIARSKGSGTSPSCVAWRRIVSPVAQLTWATNSETGTPRFIPSRLTFHCERRSDAIPCGTTLLATRQFQSMRTPASA
jgi:hypothetical protein